MQQKVYRRKLLPVRVKWWRKRPPGATREPRRTGKPLPQQDQIGNELLLAALPVPGSGRIRQMIAAGCITGTESGLSQLLPLVQQIIGG